MDLPKDQKISKEEMKNIMGGTFYDQAKNAWNKSIDDALDPEDFDQYDLETLLK
jgi:hypothetical protein